jgi:hypothetical protein
VAGSPFELIVLPSPADSSAVRPAAGWDRGIVAGANCEIELLHAPFLPAQILPAGEAGKGEAAKGEAGKGGSAKGEAAKGEAGKGRASSLVFLRTYAATLEASVEVVDAPGGSGGVLSFGGDVAFGWAAGGGGSRVPVPVNLKSDGTIWLRFVARKAGEGYRLHVRAGPNPYSTPRLN